VVPFNRDRLACRVRIVDDSIHLVRLCVVRIVVHVRPEYTVVVANFVVHPGGVKVFGYDLQAGKYESANVWIAGGLIGARIHSCQQSRGVRVHCYSARVSCADHRASGWWTSSASGDRSEGEGTTASSIRRNPDRTGDAFSLAKSFIVTENECLVLDDGPTGRTAKLIAPERWPRTRKGASKRIRSGLSEVIIRVQRAVPDEFVHISVKLVGARFADCVDDSARSPSVLGRKAARQDGKFLNRVNAKNDADDISGSRHRIVDDADAVDSVIVEGRSLTGNSEFCSEAAVAARGGIVAHLRFDPADARLKCCQ